MTILHISEMFLYVILPGMFLFWLHSTNPLFYSILEIKVSYLPMYIVFGVLIAHQSSISIILISIILSTPV